MSRVLSALIVVGIVALDPPWAAADSCVLPTGGRIYASDSGMTGFRLTMRVSTSEGELFSFDAASRERRLWKTRLVAAPARVLLTDAETVITIDTPCRSGYEHSLVVYGEGGRVLADYRLEDLLTPEEIRAHVKRSMSSRFWTDGADVTFDHARDRLRIRFPWGLERAVDLTTGKIIGPDAPSPFLQPLNDEDREILRAVIETLKPDASTALLDSTVAFCQEGGRTYCLPVDVTARATSAAHREFDATARIAFAARNVQSWPLGPLGLNVRTADGAKVRSLFKEGRGWYGVNQLLPNVRSLIHVSAPSYTTDRRYAIVFAEQLCDGRCGGGALYLLERKAGRWKVSRSLHDWQG
jgi:hypothetical protein